MTRAPADIVRAAAVTVAVAAGLLGAVTITALDASPSPFLERRGDRLRLDGRDYRMVGVNAFSMATSWSENFGCGGPIDPDVLFPALPGRAAVRLWAWQGSMATNPRTLTRDWGPLDRVVAAAERHGVVLVLSLASQAGDCDDGHWKDLAWWENGFLERFDEDGYSRTTVPYVDWVREIVVRYRHSPAVGVWELVNEGEASDCPAPYRSWRCYGHLVCPSEDRAARAMRRFFDVVGRMVKTLDPNHLVGSGVIGGGQCGAAGDSYRFLHDSPEIDLASFHDYGAEDQAMPGDPVNGLRRRLEQAASLGKPLLVGESGIRAGDGAAGCRARDERAAAFDRKLAASFGAGADGYLLWDVVAQPAPGCGLDLGVEDPAVTLLRRYRAR